MITDRLTGAHKERKLKRVKITLNEDSEEIYEYVSIIQNNLLPNLMLKARRNDPVKYKFNKQKGCNIDLKEWSCLGTGNYAAVFKHKRFESLVVKIYADSKWINTKEALKKEAEVYKKLGRHESYSYLYFQGENFLVLELIKGITLYTALQKGIKIKESVIKDVNSAIAYAKKRGLNPYDVHGKNVMILPEREQKAVIVDVSDFCKEGVCTKWIDFERAYNKFYLNTLYKYPVKLPKSFLYLIRKSYRLYKTRHKYKLRKRASL